MVTLLAPHPMESIFLSSFVLLEHLALLLTNTGNKLSTQKLLKQGYQYHKLRKTFSKFYRRYYDLISKFQVGLCVGPTGVYLLDFFCSGIQFNLLLSPYPCFISLLYLDLYVLGDDTLIS